MVEAYAKEQGLWHDPAREPVYSEELELDLATVVPSSPGRNAAGPDRARRRQDRVPRRAGRASSRADPDNGVADTFPASDPVADERPDAAPPRPTQSTLEDGTEDHAWTTVRW